MAPRPDGPPVTPNMTPNKSSSQGEGECFEESVSAGAGKSSVRAAGRDLWETARKMLLMLSTMLLIEGRKGSCPKILILFTSGWVNVTYFFYFNNVLNSLVLQVKPEYQNELMDQLDLLVLGGYYGSGRGGGKVTHFLMGVADREEGGDTNRFLSFCRVGSGYTAAELQDPVAKCGRPLSKQPGDVVCEKQKPGPGPV